MLITLLTGIMQLGLASNAPPDAERPAALADATFIERVRQLPGDYRTFGDAFVAVQPSKAVSQDRLAAKVLGTCRDWVGKMLREPYASKLVAATWTGYATDTHMDEMLVASVAMPEVRLTWSDEIDPVFMLIDFWQGGRS